MALLDSFSDSDGIDIGKSVTMHLARMLNTLQGSGVNHSYGLLALSSYFQQLPQSLAAVKRMILSVIERFEPRLRVLESDITQTRGDLSVVLHLRCGFRQHSQLGVAVTIAASGQVIVEAMGNERL